MGLPVNGGKVSATGRAAVVHEFNPARSLKASSLAAPGFFFYTEGMSAPVTSGQFDLGLDWEFAPAMNLTFKGTYRPYDGGSMTGGRAGLQVSF